jgi:hypothetical protein
VHEQLHRQRQQVAAAARPESRCERLSVSSHELPAIHPPRLVDVSVESSPFRKITQSALARHTRTTHPGGNLGYVLVSKARNDMQVGEGGNKGGKGDFVGRSLFERGAARVQLADEACATLHRAGKSRGTAIFFGFESVCAACVIDGERFPPPRQQRAQPVASLRRAVEYLAATACELPPNAPLRTRRRRTRCVAWLAEIEVATASPQPAVARGCKAVAASAAVASSGSG